MVGFIKTNRAFRRAGKKWKGVGGGGKLFAREHQTASACPIGQNAETKFPSSLIEKRRWARAKIGNWRRKFC
jgi:hypothetical protein